MQQNRPSKWKCPGYSPFSGDLLWRTISKLKDCHNNVPEVVNPVPTQFPWGTFWADRFSVSILILQNALIATECLQSMNTITWLVNHLQERDSCLFHRLRKTVVAIIKSLSLSLLLFLLPRHQFLQCVTYHFHTSLTYCTVIISVLWLRRREVKYLVKPRDYQVAEPSSEKIRRYNPVGLFLTTGYPASQGAGKFRVWWHVLSSNGTFFLHLRLVEVVESSLGSHL